MVATQAGIWGCRFFCLLVACTTRKGSLEQRHTHKSALAPHSKLSLATQVPESHLGLPKIATRQPAQPTGAYPKAPEKFKSEKLSL